MNKLENEISHGKNIVSKAELIWGWDTPAGKIRAARRAEYFIKLGGIEKGKKVLEIGCGTGLFTRKIAETAADLTAIDISPELIEKAAANFSFKNALFMTADAEHLNFAGGSFDCVVGSSVLHHLNLGAALGEIFRVLKPGGKLVFAEPNMLNPQILLQKNIKFLGKMLGDTPDETAFFRGALAGDLKKAGFTNINIAPYDFLHPWIPPALIAPVRVLGSLLEKLPLIKEIAGSLIIEARK
ncbi:MAG TPA: hypothetical protein DEE98_03375 [Elusimicrobia bacterium]|nr:MAG: hypothetical protein A2278_08190 [Elusimicrobia bacterium RIFOXYA12_FULL_49_49]OGS09887.1 MAG: hypothetical protein A2204_05575 [Elusimicrobia bacterium RIFOXYA1_FULL_47_7]OGS11058.1 MAG: hypothetical protein A2386_04325 [Elusimicrobia bacterium RIFOXYB1_FULL_48_9]OGS15956.1 MAG: hypothetical protein A2251_02075 [Elusimicrobia bacterium RIFOXYA2_FULL_47_53]OGS29124.1 MAG: hypothetical protein A2323_04615 [Elusimicrobia bacterium RIFOXYB2_FULL_46_23]HBU69406.1 hypothetical protein [Elus